MSIGNQKKKKKKRMIKRLLQRGITFAAAVLFLVLGWKVTNFAISNFPPEPEEQINSPEEEESVDTEEEKEEVVSTFEKLQKQKILLVNKEHPLEDSYQPQLKKLARFGVQVDETMCQALNDMLEAGEKEGLRFWVASGYRSLDRQRELLDEDIGDLVRKGYSYSEAYEEVVRQTMPVGCSEHATGLAVDIVAKDYQLLDEKQAETEEIKWLQKNCSQYGFILRYPKDKEDITKISYESWHFRYVGVDAAKEIMEQGISLEEYLEDII